MASAFADLAASIPSSVGHGPLGRSLPPGELLRRYRQNPSPKDISHRLRGAGVVLAVAFATCLWGGIFVWPWLRHVALKVSLAVAAPRAICLAVFHVPVCK